MGYIGQKITTVFPTSISVDTATITTANISNQLTDANMSAGSIIQIINASTTTEVATTSSSFSDTGVTATITPSSTSSKIFILFTLHKFINASGATSDTKLLRGSTELLTTGYMVYNGGSTVMAQGTHHFLDSPSTTSATTYKVQFNSRDNSSDVRVVYDDSAGNASSFITLMEIAQ